MPQHISFDGSWKCSIHESFLYDGYTSRNRWLKATILGATSYASYSMTFHVLIEESGGIFSCIPIDALANRKCAIHYGGDNMWQDGPVSDYSYRELDYHFCPDDNMQKVVFSYMEGKPVAVWIKSNGELKKHVATYMATFDWPDGNSLQHLVELGTGQYALVPNHKLIFGKNIEEAELPDYKKLRQEWV